MLGAWDEVDDDDDDDEEQNEEIAPSRENPSKLSLDK